MKHVSRRRFTAESIGDLLRRGLITAAFSCIVAVAVALSGHGDWGTQFVYSLSIGMISWLVIDPGRQLLRDHRSKPWPHGLPGIALVVAGVTMGFLAGNAIGNTWSGKPLFDFHFAGPGLPRTLVITVAAAGSINVFFYNLAKRKHLQGQVALAQRDAAEARLKLLETQLEPHMLFNTLANLRALIQAEPVRAVAMLDRLNGYLRATLGGSRTILHPLASEFDRLRDYLELMSVRMGDRLRYSLDLPDELRRVPVPPLLLQPLVENAVRHGLEPKVDGGEITVRAYREVTGHGTQLVIEVADTGVGLRGAVPTGGSGFGLEQVRERLATVYGTRGTMSLTADPAGVTRATLTFPEAT
ncbi:histidine kinase [Pendulispora rubella]|uniref:Histidine kinase n=1 Tax=Pendulispora rubella TaxID=2741070 RepID=A0ABZ2KTN3_9BACT